MRPPPSIGDHVDHASDGVGAIERRSGAAHHFDAVGIGEEQVFDQARSVRLSGGGVAQTQAIHQHSGVFIAKPAHLNGGERAGAAELLYTHAGRE